MEIGEVLERIIRPFAKVERVENCDLEVEKITHQAAAWVTDSLVKSPSELETQPFSLTPPDINIIQTRLTETKAQEILAKGKYKKHQKEIIGASLNNFFDQKYNEIRHQLVKDKDLEGVAGVAETLENYFAILKKFAPKFIYGQSNPDELIETCNKIRGKSPAILVMRRTKVNS